MPTETQATDSQGNLLYNQVQYVYRDADGKKVNSNEDWSCKFPVTDYTIVPNEVKSTVQSLITVVLLQRLLIESTM